MAEQQAEFAQPVVKKPRSGPSLVWLVPIVAAVIGGWLAIREYRNRGPLVTIVFDSAEGLEEGKTLVKHKDVTVGKVETITLTEDIQRVKVIARLDKSMTEYLGANTRFWVVKPRIGAGRISGLSTLIAGAYIEMEPGDGKAARDFIGLELPPVTPANAPGRKLRLRATALGSIGIGSPVLYRKIPVGQVEAYRLKKDEVVIDVYIHKEYASLVRSTTKFWNASGVSLTLDARGLNVRSSSLETLLRGGIAFETPVGNDTGAAVGDGASFQLYSRYEDIGEEYIGDSTNFILYFENSVRGLRKGAPVEFRGIKVGVVTDVSLEYDVKRMWLQIPVKIRLERGRFRVVGGNPKRPLEKTVAIMVRRGLRAQASLGSLLTGALYISLDFDGDAPLKFRAPKPKKGQKRLPEIPTLPSSQEQLFEDIVSLVNKLRRLPIEPLLKQGVGTLKGIDKGVITARQQIVSLVQLFGPLMAQLGNTSQAATDVLKQGKSTLKGVQKMISSGGPPIADDLSLALRELTKAAAAIRNLAKTLERQPESLIRGKADHK